MALVRVQVQNIQPAGSLLPVDGGRLERTTNDIPFFGRSFRILR